MRPNRLAILAFLFAGIFTSLSASQEPPNTPRALDAAAMKAYAAKDYVNFLFYEKRALELEPASPRLLYNVACGEALTNHAADALRLLNQLVDRNLDLGAETDEDFAGIRNTPEWAEFVLKLAALRKPLIRSLPAFSISDPTVLATGLAIDSSSGDIYIASVRQRKILRRSKDGAISDFIRTAQDGFMAGASLLIDHSRKLLYASTAAVPYMVDYGKEDAGQSGVFAFDLKSGKLVRKAMLPVDGKPHFLNALALDDHGNVYVSDSAGSGIYRLPRKLNHLEVLIAPSVIRAAQGLAFSSDNKTLYVADYSEGLWAVDMASRAAHQIEGPADVWLGGLDGLSRVKDAFIAVQIGVRPQRVVRLQLDQRKKRVAKVEILEMNHPDYAGPIQGAAAGDSFLYVANSQLNLGDGKSGGFAADRAQPTVVLKLPL